ncbi:MAG TPA: transcription antitermination factor NusB [Bryobacteraceae bacterium]|jgi:16S rRNA (cytosine967-C5)-methyltransferase|nr:transcription antitermination factor NusB [Bryobacteraceae bacterium]
MRVTGKATHTISAPRRVALQVLAAVAQGAYAADELQERSHPLDPRDAALATQLVFGCLRYQNQLDFLISHYSGRPAARLDEPVRLALRLAIFQIRYLERIPARAAVNESVEFVKTACRSAAGFVNAVLRKVNRNSVAWRSREVELSCPEWLLARWTGHFGEDPARGIARAALAEPVAYLRIAPGSPLPEELELAPTSVPGAWRLSGGGHGLRLHDIGSQSIVPLLEIRPGDRYLDLCAAPGNKTLQALEYAPELAVACDISFRRLREMPPVCPRVVLDATEPLPFAGPFDRVFIDAPCSGTGTLARNPEIKWRLEAGDLTRFAERQQQILLRGAEVLGKNGRLLYATCSLEREENEDVIRWFLAAHPQFRLMKEQWRLPGRDEGDGFYAAVLERYAEACAIARPF